MQQSDERNIACKVYKSTDSYVILNSLLIDPDSFPRLRETLVTGDRRESCGAYLKNLKVQPFH